VLRPGQPGELDLHVSAAYGTRLVRDVKSVRAIAFVQEADLP
jgi:hypothetical protein